MKKIVRFVVFLVLLVPGTAAQTDTTSWILTVLQVKTSLDSVYQAENSLLRHCRDHQNTTTDTQLQVDIEHVQQLVDHINQVIDQLNLLTFPGTAAGNNAAADLTSTIDMIKAKYSSLVNQIKINNDILQKKVRSDMVNSLVSGVIKLVISSYIPVFK
jgi:hypothetical protein